MAVWQSLYFTPGEFFADAAKSVAWNRGACLVQRRGLDDRPVESAASRLIPENKARPNNIKALGPMGEVIHDSLRFLNASDLAAMAS